ncbi:hypothetical protein CVU37_02900 [candidate division BRC1 bacterium HGW-BRC1-1]|jgi:hypothetical protein|nr:MAG: hypothetical protein CVU37_02900 [candidate division BRC1 bacterium HGW-BRC1-1]
MGRTLPTFNTYLQAQEAAWAPFRRALRSREERDAFDHLFTLARTYAAEATNVARPLPFEAILMAVALGQQMELAELRQRLDEHREDDAP